MNKALKTLALAVILTIVWPSAPAKAETGRPRISYRDKKVGDINIFYREAGSPSRPTVVLLHGFPSSSHMYRDLIPKLAGRYHVIAPDLPGFGYSDQPPADKFEYTFAHLTDVMDDFLNAIGVQRYSIYVMDYGSPVGFRLFVKHPERVQAVISQNGNAYAEGLSPFWAEFLTERTPTSPRL